MAKREAKMSKRSLAIAGALVAAAASVSAHAAMAQSQPAQTSQEPVLAFRAAGDVLRFRVHTGGCTSADDFQLNVRRSNGQADVTLVRVTPDNCKGDFPEGTEITFSYNAAGLTHAEAVRLMNRVGAGDIQPR